MVNEKKVITDSGPLIHISEVDAEFAWKIFPKVLVPDIVKQEVTFSSLPGYNIIKDKRFKINRTSKKIIVKADKFIKKYNLTKNDGLILSHTKFIKANILLTDDLELREFAKLEKIKPVGTVGILLRSFNIGICDRERLFKILDQLILKSSLYITEDLIEIVKRSAVDFDEKK